ncbi:hypothetical protein YYC_03666 [Plasmodium yoelii 17X]|uniref:Uncharacterized protein n=1 Tax=Plasmodium yoelii 17X TaxID=1323249 RepID=V7PH76_PLAYE|nr:hypothetical protein YYC_03666 [Plasmodium yoelii 17X]
MITKKLSTQTAKMVCSPSFSNMIANIYAKHGMKPLNYAIKRNICFSKPHLTHYLEDYYTCSEIATNMVSPMSEYVWWSWLFLQGAIVFGTLLHSNYYFTGKPLPKVQGNSQLCEDSW